MKVKLLQDWIGKSAGEVIELSDEKAKRLIKTGLVAKAPQAKTKAKKPKDTKAIEPKERSYGRTNETAT